jgi:hypothetical protein
MPRYRPHTTHWLPRSPGELQDDTISALPPITNEDCGDGVTAAALAVAGYSVDTGGPVEGVRERTILHGLRINGRWDIPTTMDQAFQPLTSLPSVAGIPSSVAPCVKGDLLRRGSKSVFKTWNGGL